MAPPYQDASKAYHYYIKLLNHAHRLKLSSRLPYVVIVGAVLSGFLTYLQLTVQTESLQTSKSVIGLIYIDVLLLLLLSIIIAKKLVGLWAKRRSQQVGAKLHVNIVVIFSLVSVLPAILVTLFAGAFLNIGLEGWFADPVRNAISESQAVAKSYLQEHKRSLRFEALTLANDIKIHFPEMLLLSENTEQLRKKFDDYLSDQEQIRFFNEILVVRLIPGRPAETISKSFLTFALEVDFVSDEDILRAQSETVVIREYGDRVRAVVNLDAENHLYLFVGKFIDKNVLKHVEQTNTAYSSYKNLEIQKSGLTITFLILFAVITLLLLLSAIWIGLTLATMLVRPIEQLIKAADAVSHGNLDVKVKHNRLNNEIDILIDSFNSMTDRLKKQQQALIHSEKQAAWSDVARKIAHEIKNPLTPIQLSAERLKRKYLKVLTSDQDTFTQCIDTIIRQVSHIGNLVSEFSNFARMPEPKMSESDIKTIMMNCVVMEKSAHRDIFFDTCWDKNILFMVNCDSQQMAQTFTNIIQNSINALQENMAPEDHKQIVISIVEEIEDIIITVEDNGPGFPKESREKLLDPYYTTREKGTGLGLAIASKIISDHYGKLSLEDSSSGGALIRIILNRSRTIHEA
jgi:two-component system nitrogen regulation sensor histidine kinase NtrY